MKKIKIFNRKKDDYKPVESPPKSLLKKEEVIKLINSIPFWWHKIEVGYGIVTPGKSATHNTLLKLNLPDDLTGKRVLDIGAWDGYFSFEAEKRGAKEVLAIDNYYRLENNVESSGFEVAKKILNSNVKYKKLDVYDISPEQIGCFDLVLFLGVLYHLKHPLLALEKIYSITKELLILESFFITDYKSKAIAVFYPHDELSKDKTNWWGLNEKCIRELLITVGFKNVKCVSNQGDRIVFHAFK